ncbi:transglutaminase-like domain-containing protein [Carboxylicivirga marina]|uniref:Transglutaminase domain-containing protein n=1 Tax=Carboxylicivirga marina TaxID=2800988 RepID=A0ABS1HQ28_9BACT|nr:transglutaminase-like domain-containing protein [Carboxylicivirga marina]MBK3519789.1 transglutaminase domain-containing protein [Carboxylicivirga marina]
MLRTSLIILSVLLALTACNKYPNVPKEYHSLLDVAISKAGQNSVEIKKAIESAPAHQKEAIAYLIAFMPERDLLTLNADFILENTDYAFMARERYNWAKSLPDSIFFNEVLPYASLNERRDNWRKDFFERFSKYVENCKTVTEAIDSLNKNIRDELMVDYNTKREKPDQSPYESMEQNMASCSGLSILLTDAFRAVGIPSRIGGTPNWHDKRGNHNWNEVWVDGEWFFTEYYPSGFNKSWFLADAGKAIPNNPRHAIYASSWKPSDTYFPLVWDLDIKYVHAENVSERYIRLYQEAEAAKKIAQSHVRVKVMMFKDNVCTFQGDDRVAVNVDVFCNTDQIGGGKTAGPKQDMNDVLEFVLEKNKIYNFNYTGDGGQMKSIKLHIKEEPQTLKLYYK